MDPKRSTHSVLILLVAFAGFACQQLPQVRGQEVRVLEEGALVERNPVDIVVAPVQLAAEGLDVPERNLRRAVQTALISRRYSPLDLDFVDTRLIEASAPAEASGTPAPTFQIGSLGEDAVCQIIVHGWSETHWETGRQIDADVELRMIDAADPSGPVLWAGRMDGIVDVTREETRRNEIALHQFALEELARELLAPMPPREAAPGRE